MSAKPAKARLDELVVARGLADSRTQAQALILAGRVLVDDTPIDKPGTRVRPTRRCACAASPGATSRAAARSSRARSRISGRSASQASAASTSAPRRAASRIACFSTARRHVIALDVGYGQLDVRLRGERRVSVLERMNARELSRRARAGRTGGRARGGGRRFISATLVLPRSPPWRRDADVLVMVKPQFEVGRERVGKGGVVRDDADRAGAVAPRARGGSGARLQPRGEAESRLAGPAGNREVFLWLAPGRAVAGSAGDAA